jgi:uncharacterized protein YeaO (DUF488 family)
MAEIRLQRVYGSDAGHLGMRVLVDRVWPRGVKKEDLRLDHWFRELGPSDQLRKWFGHRPERWPEFQRRYREELSDPARRPLLDQLVELARRGPLVLLFGAADEERNQAVVLRSVLEERLRS